MDIKGLKVALKICELAKVTPFIHGHRGIGKTESIVAYGLAEGFDSVIDLRLGTQEVGDLIGLQSEVLNAKGEKVGTKFLRPEWFPTKGRHIIFLDEINRARKEVLQAAFQLVYDRKIHTHTLPEGCFVVVAGNPNTSDYTVTDVSDSAFMDRFCHIKLEPTAKEWLDYAKTQKVNEGIIDFVTHNKGLLDPKLEDYSLDIKPSRRSLRKFSDMFTVANKVGASKSVIQELACGMLGVETGVAITKHITEYTVNLTLEDVTVNFEKNKARIKELAKDGNRVDLLNKVIDEALDMYSKMKESDYAAYPLEQISNFNNFILLLPKDLGYATINRLFLIEGYSEYYEGKDKESDRRGINDELYEYFVKLDSDTQVNKEVAKTE